MSRKLTYEEVKNRVESRGFKLISEEYFRNSEKLEYECSNGHRYHAKFNDFSNGHGCPYCAGLARHSYDYIKNEIEKQGYSLMSDEYINAKQKLKMVCPKGHICFINWNNFSNGFRCKKCSNSKGEKRILEFLNKYNIRYETQWRFHECRRVFPLPFDFYLPDYNICIEYDGEQHFKPTVFSGMTKEKAIAQFELTKENDKIKTKYCLENSITLIRIPYTDIENIDTILQKLLIK